MRVALEVGWSWVGDVKKLGESLTFVSTCLLTFCNIPRKNL